MQLVPANPTASQSRGEPFWLFGLGDQLHLQFGLFSPSPTVAEENTLSTKAPKAGTRVMGIAG